MKKAITIYVDDCVESIEEVNATFVLHKPTGATSVHMINLNWKDIDTLYIPWRGDVVMGKEGPSVTCKDCKHVQHDEVFDRYWCNGREVTADWYCADGERV